MNSKVNFLIAAVVTLLICQLNLVNAQNFGFEIGTAGVENFDPGVLNLGFSINLPLNDKVCCDLSYNYWQGKDGNYQSYLESTNMGRASAEWSFFGNSGLNLTMFYMVYGTNKFSISLGSGLGSYKRMTVARLGTFKTYYEATFSFSTLIKYKISKLFAIYGKTIISTKSFDFERYRPNWGIFNLGLELSPFK
ncbi:MAG: hypothetical protein ACT6FF_07210 [Methanosarcinaceae archaeon]